MFIFISPQFPQSPNFPLQTSTVATPLHQVGAGFPYTATNCLKEARWSSYGFSQTTYGGVLAGGLGQVTFSLPQCSHL